MRSDGTTRITQVLHKSGECFPNLVKEMGPEEEDSSSHH